MAQKETILGNYLGFARFPLDCESIEYLQANTQLLAVIARLSGCDKLILSGCDGDPRKEGYVYIRTGNDLVGEVVYFKGGTGTRCKIVPTNFDVTANGETFRNAYTKRILEPSSSPSDMAWGDFTKLSDISNAALKTAVNETLNSAKAYTDQKMTLPSVAFVRGMIMMWSGAANQIPNGWVLCDGRTINGERIPDLRNKFIVGAGGEYNVGAQSGVKTQSITLTVNNMPRHNHTGTTTYDGAHTHTISHKGYYDCKGDNKRCMSFETIPNDPTTYSFTCSSSGGHSHTITTNNSGNGLPFTFDNRPPFYALCYIMKL